ncbi:hypothetical protein OS493_030236 [Desmophyllum pertusum]|uniref:Uncharacterized protein n=1 Tax=Desmophyllum pertusum TaxID=174260 RepID=A0A9W9Y8S3_9CNID|nr:hypothetical protein OS493_030236 [Desmophyllum pertusum]
MDMLSPSVDKNGDTVIGSEDGEKNFRQQRSHRTENENTIRPTNTNIAESRRRNTNTAVNARRRRNAAKQVQVTLAVQRATAMDSHDTLQISEHIKTT